MIEEIKKEIKELKKTKKELNILGFDVNIDYISLGRVIEILDKYNNQEKQTTIFIDTEDMEERYGTQLYIEYLEEKLKKIEEYIYGHKLFGMRYGKTLYRESLINILSIIKGGKE